ncbi:MBL fold metallo-hydrolase [Aspergillus homomorphus CBS 101889]|uniref:Metallo-beta-lactamase domain-containing protein n=1 Tax=Aspergillus homomorphus (strain CBS 101889) TaxID=1450537 RepID=A0A395HQW1_ASPHC|nr:hypothetical protein BO97DRAFT_373132 [Aspergillus homomorphus CBS 101889]RAL10207.1 hypothetical protein BO97DRAFT_373132 [Aspergillus homomorphus CBS 101889]
MAPINLNIPASDKTVEVSIIDTTANIQLPADVFFAPEIGGLKQLRAGAYAFLVENKSRDKRVLFDLGVRKDWENLAKPLYDRLKEIFAVTVRKDVSDILTDHSIPLDTIDAIIWSHTHFDHVGDTSTFPPSTSLVVGPGVTAASLPAYPSNPASVLLESDFHGRELVEIAPEQFTLKIGNYPAHDYFGDGSFYLLDVPGHSIGHICGLARTNTAGAAGTDSFILMGADTVHHAGQLRPSEHVPLPSQIAPNPYGGSAPCPGEIFEAIHPSPDKYQTCAFYHIHVREDGSSVAVDPEEAQRSVISMTEFDASPDVLVVFAHDTSLEGVVETFPASANGWKAAGWKETGRWRFLRDWKV